MSIITEIPFVGTVLDELCRIGYVDAIDVSPYGGGGLAAYVVYDDSKSADWVSLSRLVLLESAVDLALFAVNERELRRALAS